MSVEKEKWRSVKSSTTLVKSTDTMFKMSKAENSAQAFLFYKYGSTE